MSQSRGLAGTWPSRTSKVPDCGFELALYIIALQQPDRASSKRIARIAKDLSGLDEKTRSTMT